MSNPGVTEMRSWGAHERVSVNRFGGQQEANNMDGLIQIQVVVQGNAAVGLVGLDTQGRVWYGELSTAKSPARYSIKWTKIEERVEGPATRKA
jgi:hypothetical protein